jgi:type VI secretion system protein ImpE
VLAGRRGPVVFGQPPEWMAWLSQALHLLGSGQHEAAAELRDRAFEAAPAIAGTIDDRPFAWLADADSRFGPVFEAIVEGRYYWVPIPCVREIRLEKPVELRDLMWVPAHFIWINQGQTDGFVPARYPASEKSEDTGVRLARKTEWTDAGSGFVVGLGQRMLATDDGEYPLLESRRIVFNPAEAPPTPSGA